MMSVVQWLEPPLRQSAPMFWWLEPSLWQQILVIWSLKLRARGLITEATILVAGDITLAVVVPCPVVGDIVQAKIPIVWLLDLVH